MNNERPLPHNAVLIGAKNWDEYEEECNMQGYNYFNRNGDYIENSPHVETSDAKLFAGIFAGVIGLILQAAFWMIVAMAVLYVIRELG